MHGPRLAFVLARVFEGRATSWFVGLTGIDGNGSTAQRCSGNLIANTTPPR
jgi:hypothetical protein